MRAAEKGHKVVLLEKTERIGTKIRISGGGRCNITHAGPLEEVLKAYRPAEARFLRPSFYRWTNEDVLRVVCAGGLQVTTRPNGRVFPENGMARDVVAALEAALHRAGVEVQLNQPVSELLVEGGRVRGVRVGEQEHLADAVIVTVGGCSYPKTGTTGDGYGWMRELGHTVVPIRAALAPMRTDPVRAHLSGVALRDCVLRVRSGGKELTRWRDDLLFTHHGISGPTVLGVSRHCAESSAPVHLFVDLCPDQTVEAVASDLRLWREKHPQRTVSRWLEPLVAARIAAQILSEVGLPGSTTAQAVGKKEQNRLVEFVKNWPLGLVKEVIRDKGEVVAGGVALDEVDPHSMASRRCEGLFLAGEILDIAGPVGGYNLQAAFSTGWVAGDSV